MRGLEHRSRRFPVLAARCVGRRRARRGRCFLVRRRARGGRRDLGRRSGRCDRREVERRRARDGRHPARRVQVRVDSALHEGAQVPDERPHQRRRGRRVEHAEGAATGDQIGLTAGLDVDEVTGFEIRLPLGLGVLAERGVAGLARVLEFGQHSARALVVLAPVDAPARAPRAYARGRVHRVHAYVSSVISMSEGARSPALDTLLTSLEWFWPRKAPHNKLARFCARSAHVP